MDFVEFMRGITDDHEFRNLIGRKTLKFNRIGDLERLLVRRVLWGEVDRNETFEFEV